MSEWFEQESDMPDLTSEQWDRFDEFFKSIPNSIGKHWLIKLPAPIKEEQACEE